MCDVSGGRATAEAIPGAELVVVDGMGHDLPAGLRLQIADRIADFVGQVEVSWIVNSAENAGMLRAISLIAKEPGQLSPNSD
jgi:hypothetical protein